MRLRMTGTSNRSSGAVALAVMDDNAMHRPFDLRHRAAEPDVVPQRGRQFLDLAPDRSVMLQRTVPGVSNRPLAGFSGIETDSGHQTGGKPCEIFVRFWPSGVIATVLQGRWNKANLHFGSPIGAPVRLGDWMVSGLSALRSQG